MIDPIPLMEKLARDHRLELHEYEALLGNRTPESKEFLRRLAEETRIAVYGREVYIRGLIETTNICKNDCYYCGIRRSNAGCSRYRLTPEDILEAAGEGYTLGFRTFVLQGGEDGWFTDERTTALIRELKHRHPDCAVTLSLGERSYESYRALREAGADRYLLRHETADEEHYAKLHPAELTLQNRMKCLRNLKELGYQVGCGFMVGSPYQEVRHLAKDLKFIEEFSPAMCGIGPFITHKATPFASFPSGSFEDTIYLLSILRLIKPTLLLPATTALGTIHPKGREMGILAGANVVMPNLSPLSVRKKYELYEGKIATGEESAQSVRLLAERMESIGYKVVTARGDAKQSI
ncbi:MAG: [Clostridia bacterium]|nr:[FeFe] hydrogenase H-cluster radical SAM maturase HydE [Clostridia bacterium]